MNPAALKTNIHDLVPGGAIIVNGTHSRPRTSRRRATRTTPSRTARSRLYNVLEIPITTLNARALEGLEMTSKQVDLTKNFFALGVMFFLFERSMEPTLRWLEDKYAKRPIFIEANRRALAAGYAFGETTEIFHTTYRVAPAHLKPGTYRNITGNEATALGLLTASQLAERPLFYSSYPITPASDILHQLSLYKNFGLKTFQAEDEIAAIGAAIGASYGGGLGMTGTSGPGMALKTEMLGLAIMVELPLVVVDVQRGGPSTGLPTKTEQGDLFQALFGRNSDSPVPVVAPATPSECFEYAVEAWRLALRHMTPVIYLSDAFLATGSEPWRIPTEADLPDLRVPSRTEAEGFYPYMRDPETLADRGSSPGTPGLEHRVGGLEKLDVLGDGELRPRQPPPDDDAARREGGPDRPRHPAAGGLRAAGGRAAHPLVGFHVRRHPERRGVAPGARQVRRARAPPPSQPVPGEHGRRRAGVQTGAHPRGEHGAAPVRHPLEVPGGRAGLQPRARQAVPDQRDPDEGRARARRPVRPER